MKSLWQAPVRAEVCARLDRLAPDRPAAWGRMDAPRMLAHVNDAFAMAFGDLPTESRRLPLRHPPLKQLIIYWLPFPRSTPTAPELVARAPEAWDVERSRCRAYVDRFGSEPRARDWPEHPAFGRLTAAQWGILAYRHFDHHLRQFGA
jgi:hypothetical protein